MWDGQRQKMDIRAYEVGNCQCPNNGDDIILVNTQAAPQARGALLILLIC